MTTGVAGRGAGREQLVAEMLRRAHAHVDGKSLTRLAPAPRQSSSSGPSAEAPVTTANWRTLLRSVTGRPTLAAHACAAVMPGTTSTAMPAARTRRHLLGGAAEHERVAALEAGHALALQRLAHEDAVDLVLRGRVALRLLADVDADRRRGARIRGSRG